MQKNQSENIYSLENSRPEKPLISFIIPTFNEESNITSFLTNLKDTLEQLAICYEIIVIDDGSTDSTVKLILEMGKMTPLKCVMLSRNFGKEQALTAGLKYASGDAAILIDSDLQHPLETIEQFLKHWNEGYQMVYGVRVDRDDDWFARRYLTKIFYKILSKTSDIPIQPNAGDFRLLDRKVIDALNNLPERTRFMKGLYAWVGFKSIGIPFKVTKRPGGKSSFNLTKLTNLAGIGLSSFSNMPLRISMLVGIFTSTLSLTYAIWIVLRTLIYGSDIPGWSTVVVCILFLGGIQLITTGILGEYISHIFTEAKHRPQYIVSEVFDFTSQKDLS